VKIYNFLYPSEIENVVDKASEKHRILNDDLWQESVPSKKNNKSAII
jgi:hypothetical protein